MKNRITINDQCPAIKTGLFIHIFFDIINAKKCFTS